MDNGSQPRFEHERRDDDRRKGQRRDPRWRFDPLFAATLVNQIAPAETPTIAAYPTPAKPRRAGRFLNIRA